MQVTNKQTNKLAHKPKKSSNKSQYIFPVFVFKANFKDADTSHGKASQKCAIQSRSRQIFNSPWGCNTENILLLFSKIVRRIINIYAILFITKKVQSPWLIDTSDTLVSIGRRWSIEGHDGLQEQLCLRVDYFWALITKFHFAFNMPCAITWYLISSHVHVPVVVPPQCLKLGGVIPWPWATATCSIYSQWQHLVCRR